MKFTDQLDSNDQIAALLFLNNLCLFCVELALSLSKYLLLHVKEGESTTVASEHALYSSACSNFLFEAPFDAKHSPVCLYRDSR